MTWRLILVLPVAIAALLGVSVFLHAIGSIIGGYNAANFVNLGQLVVGPLAFVLAGRFTAPPTARGWVTAVLIIILATIVGVSILAQFA